jgi:hypothetical protein
MPADHSDERGDQQPMPMKKAKKAAPKGGTKKKK